MANRAVGLSVKIIKCPTCGAVSQATPKVIARYLPAMQARIYTLVAAAMPGGLSTDALFERMYVGTKNGSSNKKIVAVHVRFLNQNLEPFGYAVRGHNKHGYRVVQL